MPPEAARSAPVPQERSGELPPGPARSAPVQRERRYTLTGPDGRPYASTTPGTVGGHRRGRIYGRLDCPSALRALASGGYRRDRVFFTDEVAAVAAGYRPCAVCLPEDYARWKSSR
jgi:hypothetical protein